MQQTVSPHSCFFSSFLYMDHSLFVPILRIKLRTVSPHSFFSPSFLSCCTRATSCSFSCQIYYTCKLRVQSFTRPAWAFFTLPWRSKLWQTKSSLRRVSNWMRDPAGRGRVFRCELFGALLDIIRRGVFSVCLRQIEGRVGSCWAGGIPGTCWRTALAGPLFNLVVFRHILIEETMIRTSKYDFN